MPSASSELSFAHLSSYFVSLLGLLIHSYSATMVCFPHVSSAFRLKWISVRSILSSQLLAGEKTIQWYEDFSSLTSIPSQFSVTCLVCNCSLCVNVHLLIYSLASSVEQTLNAPRNVADKIVIEMQLKSDMTLAGNHLSCYLVRWFCPSAVSCLCWHRHFKIDLLW